MALEAMSMAQIKAFFIVLIMVLLVIKFVSWLAGRCAAVCPVLHCRHGGAQCPGNSIVADCRMLLFEYKGSCFLATGRLAIRFLNYI
jgi:hypothetical protein